MITVVIISFYSRHHILDRLKEIGTSEGYWSEFRGGIARRGSNSLGGCTNSDYCNYDPAAIWDDGSCSINTESE